MNLNIVKNIRDLVTSALLNVFPFTGKDMADSVYLEVPPDIKFGDFSTNIAMRIARMEKRPPVEIAGLIVREINGMREASGLIRDIKIENPGFINIYISDSALYSYLAAALKEEGDFGKSDVGKNRKVLIEFVSANPTGPLTVAHGRQAALGDSIARILAYSGYRVTKEYYINDEGVQMDNLRESVRARLLEARGERSALPEGGYKGEYITGIAKKLNDSLAGSNMPDDSFIMDFAYNEIIEWIKKDLADFGVEFDSWFSQRSLSASGKIKEVLDELKAKGVLYEKDGAVWLRSTDFSDDKDRVVVKSDGSYTYLAPDIAYHKDKFRRGYDTLINIWGPDHHGYIKRLISACKAIGLAEGSMIIIIAQLVTLYRNKKPVRMSTREGEFVTLREVLEEVGRDAGRFFFIMRRTDSHLDFDLELAKARNMDNPVYYIQYAHARICSVMNFSGKDTGACDGLELLDKDSEKALIKKILIYPYIIESASRKLEPYILLSYLQELATIFHSYYDSYRIVTEDESITCARLSLAKAVKTVLFNGLSLLGVSAPKKM